MIHPRDRKRIFYKPQHQFVEDIVARCKKELKAEIKRELKRELKKEMKKDDL